MGRDASVAPQERINIKYKTATDGQEPTGELPFRMMVLGDFNMNGDQTELEDRKPVSVDKNSFEAVMREQNLSLKLSVADKLSDNQNQRLECDLKIERMRDFEPDSILEQVPELRKLMELRQQLMTLRSKVANEPKFRRKIQELISDDAARERLLTELGMSGE